MSSSTVATSASDAALSRHLATARDYDEDDPAQGAPLLEALMADVARPSRLGLPPGAAPVFEVAAVLTLAAIALAMAGAPLGLSASWVRLFDNVERGPLLLGTAASTRALAKAASTAWTSFARSGDPNGRFGLPVWPKYEPTRRATMMFNTQSRVENDPYAAFRQLMPPRGI